MFARFEASLQCSMEAFETPSENKSWSARLQVASRARSTASEASIAEGSEGFGARRGFARGGIVASLKHFSHASVRPEPHAVRVA